MELEEVVREGDTSPLLWGLTKKNGRIFVPVNFTNDSITAITLYRTAEDGTEDSFATGGGKLTIEDNMNGVVQLVPGASDFLASKKYYKCYFKDNNGATYPKGSRFVVRVIGKNEE